MGERDKKGLMCSFVNQRKTQRMLKRTLWGFSKCVPPIMTFHLATFRYSGKELKTIWNV